MKKIKIILFSTVVILFSIACQKDNNGNRITYYKTIGEGYIVERDNNKPIKGVKIIVSYCTNVTSCYEGISFTGEALDRVEEIFTTDENGYYKFRFAKRVNAYKVERYRFHFDCSSALPPSLSPHIAWYSETSSGREPFSDTNGFVYLSDIKDKKNITFDTIKYYQANF